MREIITEKLSKMEDLEQRKLLKDIMAGLFINLIDYQETANKNLEDRIFDEIEDIERKYDIYVTVCPKNDVDPVDEFLYPILPMDMEEKKYDMKEIAEKLNRRESMKLFNIFMRCDYPEIRKLMTSEKSYRGEMITGKRKYAVKVKLQPNQDYMNEVERLYHIFQKNNIPWKTVNNPYVNKFFDVILLGCEGVLDENEEIAEIKIDFEEYEKYKITDIVPLWNIERIPVKSDGFPMPAIDKVNYEHSISLKKLGLENGYLVDEEDSLIKYIKRNEAELVIVSPQEKAGTWDILRIRQHMKEQGRKYPYELVSNSRKNSFINKYAQKQASLIRTKGEIIRIMNSFEASKYFEMEAIEVRNNSNDIGMTYDMNSFIIDDIRIGNDKKVMKLKFRTNAGNHFMKYDLLSFIVSEIQMYFPEYACEGELV